MSLNLIEKNWFDASKAVVSERIRQRFACPSRICLKEAVQFLQPPDDVETTPSHILRVLLEESKTAAPSVTVDGQVIQVGKLVPQGTVGFCSSFFGALTSTLHFKSISLHAKLFPVRV